MTFLKKMFIIVLVFHVFIISLLQNNASAGMTGSKLTAETRAKDMDTMQRFLDNRVVSEKLSGLGYTKEEIAGKLNQLNNEELAFFASKAESLQKAGDPVGTMLGFILAMLLIVLLVVLILELTGSHIVVHPKRGR